MKSILSVCILIFSLTFWLQVLREKKNYGGLTCVDGVKEALLGKQLETLERIFSTMKDVL